MEIQDYSHLTDEELQAAFCRTCNVYAQLANERLGANLPIPVPVTFDLCETDPKVAARAVGNLSIRVNMILYRDNVRDMLNETAPHELGHLVQFDKFHNRGVMTTPHGFEWQEIMKRLGRSNMKYHNYDISKAVEWQKNFKKEQKAAEKARLKAESEDE